MFFGTTRKVPHFLAMITNVKVFKGIQGVPVKDQAILLDAFNHPTHPIKLIHTYKSGGAK